jgi:hypothetical protein
MRDLTLAHTLRDVEAEPGEGYDEDVASVLRSALAGDGEGVVGTFHAAADRKGADAAYDIAWSLAAKMVGNDRPRGTWRLEFPGIDDAEYDARWVARFVSAYANEDVSTGAALFEAAIADGKLHQCLMTLAGSAIATLRRRVS